MSGIYCIGALELLVVSGGARPIDELWGEMLIKFQYYPDFYSLCPTVESFESFIKSQTALFKVFGGIVYMTDVLDDLHKSQHAYLADRPRRFSSSFPETSCQINIIEDVATINNNVAEMEAVEYFQSKLLKISERAIPIRLFGEYLLQAPASVRTLVGPAENIVNFLLRHPLFFQIDGDYVSLSTSQKRGGSRLSQRRLTRPYSYQVTGKSDYGAFNDMTIQGIDKHSKSVLQTIPVSSSMVILNVIDCKAVMWLIEHFKIEESSQISLKDLLSEVMISPKVIHDAIGWTQIDLIEFLRKYPQLFQFSDSEENISLQNTTLITLIVVLERPEIGDTNVLLGSRGNIFRIEKLWGIIDLGFHEHVFFDKSLFKHVTDLTKHFKVNETVTFNAQRAPKESRAKWRATCVWKETEKPVDTIQPTSPSFEPASTKTPVTEDPDSGLEKSQELKDTVAMKTSTIKQKYFADIASTFDCCVHKFAALRIVEPWEVQTIPTGQSKVSLKNVADYKLLHAVHYTISDCDRSSSSSPVSEMNTLSDIPSISAGGMESHIQPFDKNSVEKQSHYIDPPEFINSNSEKGQPSIIETHTDHSQRTNISVGTQTLFTGEIMATKLYHDGLNQSAED